MGGVEYEFELRQGTVNLRGTLAGLTIQGAQQHGLFDMFGGKLTLDGDKILDVPTRILAGVAAWWQCGTFVDRHRQCTEDKNPVQTVAG